jgi:hypothetical protein
VVQGFGKGAGKTFDGFLRRRTSQARLKSALSFVLVAQTSKVMCQYLVVKEQNETCFDGDRRVVGVSGSGVFSARDERFARGRDGGTRYVDGDWSDYGSDWSWIGGVGAAGLGQGPPMRLSTVDDFRAFDFR